MKLTFTIDDETFEKITEWKKTLPDQDVCGTIGDRFQYIFSTTSLGVSVVVKDCVSGESKDFTDYEGW